MTKQIEVLSGNPGVGKTQVFIDGIDDSKHYVYACPTRVLAHEVMKRLDELGKKYQAIFTSQTNEVGSVILQANKALEAKDSPILVITHKCLASLRPELLKGWHLFVDEAPKVEQIENTSVLASEYEQVIAPYVGDCDMDGYLLINDARAEEAWEIHTQGLEDAKNKRMRNRILLLVLDAMLTPTKNATATCSKDSRGRNIIRLSVEGFVDFTRAFTYADAVTLMGANIERSLLAVHAQKKGFDLQVNKDINYKQGLPTILPLVRDAEGAWVSKTMLLTMPDGSVAKDWNPECYGQKVLDEALKYIGDKKAIFASHEWCQPTLPDSVERIPYDSRGLNKWRDIQVSIHIIHGNPSPDEYAPIKRILEKMEVPLDEGREALRWSREEDLVVQHAHRTSVRNDGNQQDTYLIVTSLTQARRLSDALGGARVIGMDLLHEPPVRAATEGQSKREMANTELGAKAQGLQAEGFSLRKIAKELGISVGKTHKLIQ